MAFNGFLNPSVWEVWEVGGRRKIGSSQSKEICECMEKIREESLKEEERKTRTETTKVLKLHCHSQLCDESN